MTLFRQLNAKNVASSVQFSDLSMTQIHCYILTLLSDERELQTPFSSGIANVRPRRRDQSYPD